MIGWSTTFLLSLVALQRLSLAGASHFRHGSISFAPTDSYSNTMRVTFRLAFRRSFSSSYNCDQSIKSSGRLLGSGDSWNAACVDYYGYNFQCSGRRIADTGFRCTDYSSVEDWSMGENNFTYNFPSFHDKWLVSYTSCCWISLSRYSGGSWLVTAIVNLTRRADNGRINSSPVSRSPAIVRWQAGCPQHLRIPIEDPDGDAVKCRWATYSESRKYPNSFPYGHLEERTCLLSYNGSSGTTGTYAVTLALEDFPAGTTDFSRSWPFSSVGLQFLVIISARSGSCSNKPMFTASTPNDGECSEVQIGSAYKTVIEVKLADFSKYIVEIVTSSPSGMQFTSLQFHGGVYKKNVTWYPSQYQVGQQLFCFKALDSQNMESEYRCVTILVGLSNTPRIIMGSQIPRNPVSRSGPGFIFWSIQFDRVIKKPRTSSYIRLVLLPSGRTFYKVNILSQYVRILSDHTTLQFAMPNAVLSMNGSYAILIDQGAVVGQGCSFDGPPTPGITSFSDWYFSVDGICPVGYYLAPPAFTYCVDINECGSHSRSKRSYYYYWWGYTSSAAPLLTVSDSYGISPTASASYLPFSVMYPGSCSSYIHLTYYNYYNSRTHYFKSPNYPSCYPNNKFCTWLIETNAYNYIFLYFYQLNLEYGGSNCPNDYLEIRDGNTLSSPLITKMCGSLGYTSIYSSGRFLLVRFVSNGYLQMNGFQAYCYATRYRYSNWIPSQQLSSSATVCLPSHTQSASISPTTWTSPTASSLYVTVTGISPTASSSYVPFSVMYPGPCSSYIHLTYYHYYNSRSHYFQSPNYPGCYPNNKDCTWLIETNAYNYIYLQVNQLNLEYGDSNCPNDYLEIRDGNTLSSPLITKMCGSLGYTSIYSSGRFLLVHFVSDGYLQMPGFRADVYARNSRYSNWIPSQQLSSSATVCLPSQAQSASISPTPYLQISPTTSSSTSSSHYAQSSSYALPIPSDFQLHVSADCAQNCRNTPGSYSCSCVSGYQLASDGKSCLDINECSINNGGCSHNCYNIPGSFYCGCPEGTTMAANNLTCVEPGVTVLCDENNMTVSLEKLTFPFFNVSSLHLRYSSCRATQNSTHLLIHTPLNGCGTQVNETQDALIFWNEIQVEVVVIDYVITRTHDIRLPFSCSYSRRKMLSITFKPRNVFFGVEAGYGNFTFKMDFYKTAAFGTPHSEYPIQVPLSEYVYVEYSVESSARLVIMAENCKATKSENSYSWPQYSIIQNGCPRDTTLDYNYDPTRSFQRFKIKTFRFFDDYNTVYFHCEVLACYRYSPNSRCSRSCLNNKKRKRREVTRDNVEHGESTTKTVLTGGPILITEEKQNTGDTGQSNKQAAMIGGVAGASGVGLIAIIALAVLFVKYRIARRFMNRSKVGDLYTTQDEQLSRRNAYIQEDDMIEREDSF